jgi:hypothetical protein
VNTAEKLVIERSVDNRKNVINRIAGVNMHFRPYFLLKTSHFPISDR